MADKFGLVRAEVRKKNLGRAGLKTDRFFLKKMGPARAGAGIGKTWKRGAPPGRKMGPNSCFGGGFGRPQKGWEHTIERAAWRPGTRPV